MNLGDIIIWETPICFFSSSRSTISSQSKIGCERREAERIIEARELMARYSARSCP
jgi:hypothetical protein